MKRLLRWKEWNPLKVMIGWTTFGFAAMPAGLALKYGLGLNIAYWILWTTGWLITCVTAAYWGIYNPLRVLGNLRRRRHLPASVDFLGEDEEGSIVSVTLEGGEVRMIHLPEDYDPREDGGELLMRTACPEIFTEGGVLHGAQWRRAKGDDDVL